MCLYGCGNNRHPSGYEVDLTGVGATYPQLFYDIIISNYMNETGNKVFYSETTGGGGIRAFIDKTVDFVSTDVFPTDKEIQECKSEILHIPVSLGAIVLIFNIPGVEELNLNSEVISAIYLKKINYWDDPLITGINPGSKLPHLEINTVLRSDENGITYRISQYLSETCSEWRKEVGIGKHLKCEMGDAEKGNSAVTNTVKNRKGSIGYVGIEYAILLDLPTAAIQNSSGHFIKANKQSLQYAIETEIPDDMRINLINPKEEYAYPIPCFSWILVYKNQAYNYRKIEKCRSLKSFLHYVIKPETQKRTGQLTYSQLPLPFIEKIQNLINSMEWKQ
jgi:phosphate transport system substrate-binding protein